MSITLNLPIVVDESLLLLGLDAARRANTDLKIQTFFRLVTPHGNIDCDKQRELEEFIELRANDGKPLLSIVTSAESVKETL